MKTTNNHCDKTREIARVYATLRAEGAAAADVEAAIWVEGDAWYAPSEITRGIALAQSAEAARGERPAV